MTLHQKRRRRFVGRIFGLLSENYVIRLLFFFLWTCAYLNLLSKVLNNCYLAPELLQPPLCDLLYVFLNHVIYENICSTNLFFFPSLEITYSHYFHINDIHCYVAFLLFSVLRANDSDNLICMQRLIIWYV